MFVALLVEVYLLLDLLLGESLRPLVVVGIHHVGGNSRHDSLRFGNEFGVENLGDVEEAVPLRVVKLS